MNVDESPHPSDAEEPGHEPNEEPLERARSPKERYLEQTIAEDYLSLGDGARRDLFEG